MKCFYHNSVDAVAICKNCNRGVCPDCAAEVSNGVACKNRYEAEVEAVNYLINQNKTSYQKASSAYARNALIFY
jgi:succinate dehydrogenase/fumarate reductase-like Fe-S protein